MTMFYARMFALAGGAAALIFGGRMPEIRMRVHVITVGVTDKCEHYVK